MWPAEFDDLSVIMLDLGLVDFTQLGLEELYPLLLEHLPYFFPFQLPDDLVRNVHLK